MIDSFRGPHAFLSNYCAAPLLYGGVRYPTVEHFFQAMKSPDPAERARVAALPTPIEAKRAGRTLKLRADWGEIKEVAMLWALRQKFAPGTALAARLLATGEETLVEGNLWHDNYWGSCRCGRCGDRGQNRLGELLMQVRRELR
jgi:ribA/ribD-fused uncharacterized protein